MEALIGDPFFSAAFVCLGMILLLLEIFIPSGGILGLLSTASFVLGVFGFFHQGRPAFGFAAIIASLVFIVLSLRFALRRLRLSRSMGPDTSTSVDEELPSLLGKEGVTVSPLRPAGMARIDGHRVDVVARGKFIEKDRPVRVVDTSGNRVVVREVVREADSTKE